MVALRLVHRRKDFFDLGEPQRKGLHARVRRLPVRIFRITAPLSVAAFFPPVWERGRQNITMLASPNVPRR